MISRSYWIPVVVLFLACTWTCLLPFPLSAQEEAPEPAAPAVVEAIPAEGVAPAAGEAKPEAAEPGEEKKESAAEDKEGKEGAEAEKKEEAKDFSKVTIGTFTIHNNNPGLPNERKKARHPQLWKFYMHGITDFFAKPVEWTELLGKQQNPGRWLDAQAVVKTPFKISPMPSLRLENGASIFLEIPLIDGEQMDELRGSTVRVFVWMAGKDVGTGGTDLWSSAPGMEIVHIGLDGKPLQVRESVMKTRGTFPWHCYYTDVWVPTDLSRPLLTVRNLTGGSTEAAGNMDKKEEAKDGDTEKKAPEEGEAGTEAEVKADEKTSEKEATAVKADEKTSEKEETVEKNEKTVDDGEPYRSKGIYLKLYNPAGGTAWFSTVSWEKITDENTYALNEQQDPVTGSMAPNPSFDELPLHLCFGKSVEYPWTFLTGKKGGAFGVSDISTVAGLTEYYQTAARNDFEHLVLGVSQLADWYNVGKRLSLLPPMDEEWPAALAKLILDSQDADTGLWTYGDGIRSVAVTTAYVEGLFGKNRISREGYPDVKMPWRGLPVDEIPNAMKIVDTVLGMQTMFGKDGRERGAWGLFAYEYKEKGELEPPIHCSLAATANAMYLLRLCVPYVGRSYQNRIREGITDAASYVLAHCVTPAGLWRQSEVDASVTIPANMPRIIEASYLLEGKSVVTLKTPVVDIPPVRKGSFVFVWKEPEPVAVSLRIYAVPKGTPPEAVTTANLVGIAHRQGSAIKETDPLLMVKAMKAAALAYWQFEWSSDLYAFTISQLRMLKPALAVTTGAEPLNVKLKGASDLEIYACTVNDRGECSRMVSQLFEIAEPGDPEEAKAESDAPAPATEKKEGESSEGEKPVEEKPAENAPENAPAEGAPAPGNDAPAW